MPVDFRAAVRRVVLAAAVASLALGLAACGSKRGPGNYLLDDIDEQRNLPDVDWDALKSSLPPVPTPADVVKVDTLDEGSRFTYGVDPRSIRVDPGLIVRYTLLAQSDLGAKNISYESLRCGTGEWRIVATLGGHNDWERARNDEWRPVNRNSIQQMLRGGVLCQGGAPASPRVDAVVKRLKSWKTYSDAFVTELSP